MSSRIRRSAAYAGRKIADTVIGTLTGLALTLVVAMIGVGAAKGDLQQGLEVPADIAQGFAQLVRAADKYLTE